LNNTATVIPSDADVDPTSANNQSTASTTVLKPRTDLSVTKTGPAGAAPDTNITYTITYANNGPDTASSVSMTDTLPAGETFVSFAFLNGATAPPTACGVGNTINCSTPSMPTGSFVAAQVVAHTASTLTDGTVLNNTATVIPSDADVDPTSANNQSTASTLIVTSSGGGGGTGGGGGGVNPGATPELDSLFLFGSGLSGLAGYAALRWRSRRRPTS
jgi:uncharacterized repeat protein (TIGR01451 family)